MYINYRKKILNNRKLRTRNRINKYVNKHIYECEYINKRVYILYILFNCSWDLYNYARNDSIRTFTSLYTM